MWASATSAAARPRSSSGAAAASPPGGARWAWAPTARPALSLARLTVEQEFSSLTPPLPKVGLAAGGTARALRKLVGEELGPSELGAAIAILRGSRSARVAKEYGIDRGRARTLVAGALILEAVQCRLNVPLRVSRTGLREGAVLAVVDEAAAAA